jgi:hypothetical protein
MNLAKNRREITRISKLPGEGRLVVRKRRHQARHPGHVRHLAGKDGLPGRSAHRRIAVVRRETRTYRGQAIEIGSLRLGVSVRSEDIAGMVVGHDEE